MKANICGQADRIVAAAEKRDYEVLRDSRSFERSTVYLTLEKDGIQITIRISDHAEAHLPDFGERRIGVSPQEIGVRAAIGILDAGPQSVEPFSEDQLSDEYKQLLEAQKESAREQAAYEKEFKRRWKTLRARLSEKDLAEFKRLGGKRKHARAMMPRLDEKITIVYAALTNGRRWQQSRGR